MNLKRDDISERRKIKKLTPLRRGEERNKTKNLPRHGGANSQKHPDLASGCFLFYNIFMKRIGILRGGEGSNYFASIKNGGDVIAHISSDLSSKYRVVDILVDRDGVWHVSGIPGSPHNLHYKVDTVWNLADPKFSITLKNFSIPCVSQSAYSVSLADNVDLMRSHLESLDLRVPRRVVLPAYQEDLDGDRSKYSIRKAKEIHEKFGAPWVVKSFTPDTSMGIHLAKTFNELVGAIEDGVHHGKSVAVEEFIAGKPAALHTLRGYRGEEIYVFPQGHLGKEFSHTEKEQLANCARKIHAHVGAGHYLKSDLLLTPQGRLYVIGISLHPDLKTGSHLEQACNVSGAKLHHLVEHIIEQALV